jgi:hypothetical protein
MGVMPVSHIASMKPAATVRDVQHTFLRVLYVDRMRNSNMLNATHPRKLWQEAIATVEARFTLSSEIGDRAYEDLFRRRCLSRVNLDSPGEHLLQISDEGLAVLAHLDDEESARQEAKLKAAKDDQRWRIGVVISLAAVAGTVLGFLVGWYVGSR